MGSNEVRKKNFVVDNELKTARVVRYRLETANFEVEETHSGLDGLRKIESFQPDLVVPDVVMEVMTGYKVCARVKDNPLTRNLPVILLTSRIKFLDEKLGFACKADAYIRKP